MPQYTPVAFELNLRPEGVVFDVGSLMDALMRLHDQRDARGVRYALSTVLVFVLLAKLCGEDSLRGIAQWVKERAHTLAELLGLAKAQAPHHTTYGRLLARAVDAEEFEQVLHDFFAALLQAGQTVQIALDGKTLRGTIPTGATQGIHLLTAYFPDEGLVFAQVAVGAHENEITAAPRLLGMLDVRGKIITADALLTQRQIAIEIVERGGEYVLPVKANQPELREDIQTLFAESCARKDRPVGCGFDRALQVEKWRIDNCQLSNCQTLREDRSRVRQGRAPQVLAAINNVVLGLWARCGYTNTAEARRHFAAHLPKAVQLILRC